MREEKKENVYDLNLEVDLTSMNTTLSLLFPSLTLTTRAAKSGTPTTMTRTNGKPLLYSFPQMLAHHRAGGYPMQVVDLLGSRTVGGTEFSIISGSTIELNAKEKNKIQLRSRDERTFFRRLRYRGIKGLGRK